MSEKPELPAAPIEMAQFILDWTEQSRPSNYSPWLECEILELGMMLSRWRAGELASGND